MHSYRGTAFWNRKFWFGFWPPRPFLWQYQGQKSATGFAWILIGCQTSKISRLPIFRLCWEHWECEMVAVLSVNFHKAQEISDCEMLAALSVISHKAQEISDCEMLAALTVTLHKAQEISDLWHVGSSVSDFSQTTRKFRLYGVCCVVSDISQNTRNLRWSECLGTHYIERLFSRVREIMQPTSQPRQLGSSRVKIALLWSKQNFWREIQISKEFSCFDNALPDMTFQFWFEYHEKSQTVTFLYLKKLWFLELIIVGKWWDINQNQPKFLNLQ